MKEDTEVLISALDEAKALFQAADNTDFTSLSVLQTHRDELDVDGSLQIVTTVCGYVELDNIT